VFSGDPRLGTPAINVPSEGVGACAVASGRAKPHGCVRNGDRQRTGTTVHDNLVCARCAARSIVRGQLGAVGTASKMISDVNDVPST
jgi:hypothetical protein